jgi:hypothetical protein
MKIILKTLAAFAALAFVASCAASAADQSTPQTWGPGWRHEQMLKAQQDGTFTPGQGPGFGRGPGFGPGYGRGMMAAAIGPDGKIDASKVDLTKLPADCPMRQALAK